MSYSAGRRGEETTNEPNTQTPKPIPATHRDLVDRPLLASLAVALPDGTPHVTPVWFVYDGEYVYYNTARGRVKDVAVRENPNVALLIQDPDNEDRWLAIRGPAVEVTEQGAREHADLLARRYTGAPKSGAPPTEVRVKVKVLPLRVTVAPKPMPD